MGDQAQGPDEQQVSEGLSAAAQTILQNAGVSKSGTADDPAKTEATTPSELTIEDGGVQRKVKLDELVDAYRKRDQLTATERIVQQKLAQVSDLEALRQLKTQLEGMPPKQRAQMLSMLQGQQSETDDDDIDLDAAVNEGQRQRAPQSDQRLDRVEQGLMAMAKYLNQNLQAERQASLREQVRTQLTQFPVFTQGEDSSAIRGLAEDSILNQLAADPSANLEQVVRSAAQKLTTLRQNAQREILSDAGVRGPIVDLPPIKGGANGKALTSGQVRQAAEAFLARQRR